MVDWFIVVVVGAAGSSFSSRLFVSVSPKILPASEARFDFESPLLTIEVVRCREITILAVQDDA